MTSCLLESAVYWQYRFSFPTDVKCLLPEISRPWMNPNEQQSFNMRVKRLFCWNKSIKQAEISVLYIVNGPFMFHFQQNLNYIPNISVVVKRGRIVRVRPLQQLLGLFHIQVLAEHIDPALPLQQVYPLHCVSLMTRWSSVSVKGVAGNTLVLHSDKHVSFPINY